jgi:hypothetical protein
MRIGLEGGLMLEMLVKEIRPNNRYEKNCFIIYNYKVKVKLKPLSRIGGSVGERLFLR